MLLLFFLFFFLFFFMHVRTSKVTRNTHFLKYEIFLEVSNTIFLHNFWAKVSCQSNTGNHYYTDTRYNDKVRYTDNLTRTNENAFSKGDRNYTVALLFNTSSNICFGYLLESPHRGDSYKYPKHMVYKEIKLNMAFVAYHYVHCEFFTTATLF